jgi:4-amino-4-deoxy-L-arabinose transferase-like glycosyltransferase
MSATGSIIILLWILFGFCELWLLVNQQKKDWRTSFICASLYFCVFVWGITEFLSFFYHLGRLELIFSWACFDICLLIIMVSVKKIRNKKGIFLNLTRFSFQKEYFFLAVIFVVSCFTAFVYPPNNWDSMTYHLPRIEHWLQNKTLRHYFSSNPRQLLSAPFAEMLILQGRSLSDNNWLMNLVQWFSFTGTVAGVSLIAGHLGLSKKMQLIAALFFATVPMAIMQSTSTQTDLVEAFFIICMAERFLEWGKIGTLQNSIDFGIALGLAILTKGTAYPISFPFVLIFGLLAIKHYKKRLLVAFGAVLLCLMLNMPHYIRNQISFGNPIGSHAGTVSTFSLKSFSLAAIFNFYSNFPVPLPTLGSKINTRLDLVDKTIFPYGPPRIIGTKAWIKSFFGQIPFHEDSVRNGFHLLLFIAACGFVLKIKLFITTQRFALLFSTLYPWLVLFSWLTFFFMIPWQPWITRLQVPLFALSAPVFSLALNKMETIKKFKWIEYSIILFFGIFVFIPLIFNTSRPLMVSKITCQRSIWENSRDELIFNNRSEDYMKAYIHACDLIIKNTPDKVGIIIGGDSWEYPLWQYLKQHAQNIPIIEYQNIDNIDKDIDILFVLDRSIPGILESQGHPSILKRKQTGWTILNEIPQ